jgi:hypothetical protein
LERAERHRAGDVPGSSAVGSGRLSACRYFIADDQLAIVDPEKDKVVLLIDKS